MNFTRMFNRTTNGVVSYNYGKIFSLVICELINQQMQITLNECIFLKRPKLLQRGEGGDKSRTS